MKRQPRYSKGDRIGGRYRVHQASMGGMGEVYLCLDEEHMMPFALKTFQDGNSDLLPAFEKEVANWIALEKHPNIVQCFWMEKFDNIPFMVLEWVVGDERKGTELRSWLRSDPLGLDLALRFTIDICRGLQHASEKVPGIVHRDIKPDNVLVNQTRQAKITDFGLAMRAQEAALEVEASQESRTLGLSLRMGNIVGTPLYMAPEQWRGDSILDARTDIYAAGCVLYEMLTSRRLYAGQTVNDLRVQHLEAPIPPLSNKLPPEVKHILDGCLAKRRENRFESFGKLLIELTQLFETHSGERLSEVKSGKYTAGDYTNRGITYNNLGQHERAIADHDLAIGIDPSLAPAYSNRGSCYAALGQYERAIADFDRAIELDSNLDGVYANRGMSYAELGQNERAIADFDRAIVLNPNHVMAYYNRANRYGALGENKRAIADFDRVIQLDPSFAQAYQNRGIRYAALGQHERAIADYDHAIQLDPSRVMVYLNKSIAHFKQGQLEEAIKHGETAALLGAPRASEFVQLLRESLEKSPMQATADDPQSMFEAFQRADSIDAMWQTVQQFPMLADYESIQEIARMIEQTVPPERRFAIERQLAWHRQIIETLMNPVAAETHKALTAFLRANSLQAMRNAVYQFPFMTDTNDFIAGLEEDVKSQLPAAQHSDFEQRLSWLRQIVAEQI